MSETPDTKAKEAATPAKSKGGALPMLVGFLLPALLAGAGSYGGARAASHGQPAAPEPVFTPEAHPPGPTVALDPFLVSVIDSAKRGHPMKLTIAVEFDAHAKEEAYKPFMPRIRDAILGHMRTMSYEEAVDQGHTEKLRADLLERCKKAGALAAERVLITDLVSQ